MVSIDKDIELEFELFIDNESSNDKFINMVDEYFDVHFIISKK